jgi:hypothetical protein
VSIWPKRPWIGPEMKKKRPFLLTIEPCSVIGLSRYTFLSSARIEKVLTLYNGNSRPLWGSGSDELAAQDRPFTTLKSSSSDAFLYF